MKANELRELDAWIAENVFKSATVVQDSPRRFGVRYRMDEIQGGIGCGGFKNTKEAWDYLWYQIKHPTTDPAAAMEVLKKCVEKSGYPVEIDRKRDNNGPWRIETGVMSQGLVAIAPRDSNSLELAICLFAKKIFSK